MSKIEKLKNNILKLCANNTAAESSPSIGAIKIISGQGETNPHEISPLKEISDTQIQREKYIQKKSPKTYKVISGDTLSKISREYGVTLESLYSANPGLNKDTKLCIGQIINIPSSRKIINVKNLSDVAKAMGVSEQFIKELKKAEDGSNIKNNKFYNTPYTDNAGVLTIGVGHAIQNKKDKQEILENYGSLNLSDSEVCELFANDLLEAEENLIAIIGQNNYNNIPQHIKEALLDMVFNKGNAIIKEPEGLIWCLKNGKYEAAINKFTYIKSTQTKQEMSGLAKRRLFDISIAIKMYENKIPQTNINTIQELYNKGIELLRKECISLGIDFNAQIIGYNQDIQSYFGDKVKLNLITE